MTNDFKFRISFSGGGFRATFFCLGAFRRLVELGLSERVTHINSVSGGSFVAAQIMCALSDGQFKSIEDFDSRVTDPLITLGQINLRNKIMWKVFHPSFPRNRFSQVFPQLLDKLIYKEKTLNELPRNPELTIHSTCLNTGKRFRFKQTNMGGNIIGVTSTPGKLKISFAVACSAAFPMMFAPYKLKTTDLAFYKKWWTDNAIINEDDLPNTLYLSDGGVYDNLGSESIIHNNDRFIICDASGFLEEWDYAKKPNWFSINWRPLDTGLDQIVLLRRRLIYQRSKEIKGCQLILRDTVNKVLKNPEKYGSLSEKNSDLPAYILLSEDHQNYLGSMRTDLDGFHDIEIKSLMWSGSVRADIVAKRYLRDLIEKDKVYEFPSLPKYPYDMTSKVLKRGTKRRYLTKLHRNLRN